MFILYGIPGREDYGPMRPAGLVLMRGAAAGNLKKNERKTNMQVLLDGARKPIVYQ